MTKRMKTEVTSARIAKIAGRVLRVPKHVRSLEVGLCDNPSCRVKGHFISQDDIRALAASCRSQAPDAVGQPFPESTGFSGKGGRWTNEARRKRAAIDEPVPPLKLVKRHRARIRNPRGLKKGRRK